MDDCIFCKIVNGKIPSSKIYEDDTFIVILDIFPSAKGHLLIIPKRHATNLYELNEKEASDLIPLSQKIAKKINETLKPQGLNILQNNGKAAGQDVFHYHMHLIPRYENDGIKYFKQSPQASKEEMDELLKLLYISCA